MTYCVLGTGPSTWSSLWNPHNHATKPGASQNFSHGRSHQDQEAFLEEGALLPLPGSPPTPLLLPLSFIVGTSSSTCPYTVVPLSVWLHQGYRPASSNPRTGVIWPTQFIFLYLN